MTYYITKNPWLGAFLTLLFDPFGFLYYSWKKAIVNFLLFFLPNLFLYEPAVQLLRHLEYQLGENAR